MQSKLESFIESVLNTLIGFVLAFTTSAILLPLMGLPISAGQNFVITLVFSVVSIVRGYLVRRFCQEHLSVVKSNLVKFIKARLVSKGT